MSDPIPVVLCGKTEQIATTVIATMKPELEVIHLILTPDAGKAQIPALLRGETDVPSDSALGSKNYSKPPAAVVTGAGYDGQAVEEMRAACKETKPVPWLRPDTTKPAPPLGPEYGKALVERIKITMKELAEQGKMNEDVVVWY
ncbi:hypothetical protein BZG36_05161 [Bifiguratus adelaidae]|uniref:Uncharacterized protein n=1 Tax=Bifiguratus adelaidae TaxID=1938954 RepID=A0A261XV85_9FUNG|nr:hypothetical protein BZG36_05161 [Bifiguratus adelaidae]